ncbi:MAG: dTDP-4-dehydrorhamnose reductase [bacterium]|nr:dTDP-4-dehydrorhamnose reductase [bacterium]
MATPRVLLLGAAGQLGTGVGEILRLAGIEMVPVVRSEFEAGSESVTSLERFGRLDYLINCIAFHKVDQCEREPNLAFDINVRFVRDLALFCNRQGASLIQISTDYVYDGKTQAPYLETDRTDPLNVYGISKLAGEKMVLAYATRPFVFRVSSLFGFSGRANHSMNFVDKMLTQAASGESIRVIEDQVMSPTYTEDAARAMAAIITRNDRNYGLYNVCNSGSCSWYEFACKIFELSSISVEIAKAAYDNFHSKVTRPQFCSMNNDKINRIHEMPHWEVALANYIKKRAQREGADIV